MEESNLRKKYSVLIEGIEAFPINMILIQGENILSTDEVMSAVKSYAEKDFTALSEEVSELFRIERKARKDARVKLSAAGFLAETVEEIEREFILREERERPAYAFLLAEKLAELDVPGMRARVIRYWRNAMEKEVIESRLRLLDRLSNTLPRTLEIKFPRPVGDKYGVHSVFLNAGEVLSRYVSELAVAQPRRAKKLAKIVRLYSAE